MADFEGSSSLKRPDQQKKQRLRQKREAPFFIFVFCFLVWLLLFPGCIPGCIQRTKKQQILILTFLATTGIAIFGAMAVLPIAVRHTGWGGPFVFVVITKIII